MNKYLFYFLLGLSLESTGQKSDTVDLRSFFGDFAGGFCVYDLSTDHYIRHSKDPERIKDDLIKKNMGIHLKLIDFQLHII
jgi:hypothetical protein